MKVWHASGMGAGHDNPEGHVNEINLSVNAGEKIALVGREFGGRSLLLKVLTGLRPIRTGELSILGHATRVLPFYADWDEIVPPHVRRQMGIALEKEGLLSNVSLREGLELLFRFRSQDRKNLDSGKETVDALCARFDLNRIAHKRPVYLTTAERRLAALARAFLSEPAVVVLENPSQAVGDFARAPLIGNLAHVVADPNRTVLISTDDIEVAQRFCPRWLVLDEGKLVFDGPQNDFLMMDQELAHAFRKLIKGEAA